MPSSSKAGKPRLRLNAQKFEDYRDAFDEFAMKRVNGIIEVRQHLNNGPAHLSWGIHAGWGPVFQAVGGDPENEVMILTGTGDQLLSGFDMEMVQGFMEALANPSSLPAMALEMYRDAANGIENLLWDIRCPTIGVINGPTSAGHTELALMCDLTLCAEDVTFRDFHFMGNTIPGDGEWAVFRRLVGDKRANYMAYMGTPVDANKALEWGLVNEVLPREKLLPRAWEIAESIMQKDKHVRLLTHEMMTQPMRRQTADQQQYHRVAELLSQTLTWLQADGTFQKELNKVNERAAEERDGSKTKE